MSAPGSPTGSPTGSPSREDLGSDHNPISDARNHDEELDDQGPDTGPSRGIRSAFRGMMPHLGRLVTNLSGLVPTRGGRAPYRPFQPIESPSPVENEEAASVHSRDSTPPWLRQPPPLPTREPSPTGEEGDFEPADSDHAEHDIVDFAIARAREYVDGLPSVSLSELPTEDRICCICRTEYFNLNDTTTPTTDNDNQPSSSEGTNDQSTNPDSDPRPPCVAVRLPCGHVVGDICIFHWLRSNAISEQTGTCPICRTFLIRGTGGEGITWFLTTLEDFDD